MPAIPLGIKKIYRRLVPVSIRKLPVIDWVKEKLFAHDTIYDQEYYDSVVEGPAVRSAGSISESVVREFKPNSVIDVGCGTGALLQAFRNKGCEIFGLEYSKAALAYCHARQLDVQKFDLENEGLGLNRKFDVAISMEVAEHLPAMVADRYVDLLTGLSKVIIFTAAPPGQGGADHVNEQPPSYWIMKFQQRGFNHADDLSRLWREQWRAAGNVESWYYQNLMIFKQE